MLVNTEIQKISRWLKINKMSVNIKKKNYIIFKSKQKLINYKLNIKIDNIEIEQVSVTKFLGVIINENLTWKNHVKVFKNKISKNMGILAKITSNVPCVILRNLYFTLLQPYLEYCNIVWSTGTSVMLNKLLVVQNKVLCIITNSPWHTHAPPIFIKLGIFTVFNINNLQTACFMYKVMNNLVPSFFVNMFTVNNAIHNYNTR